MLVLFHLQGSEASPLLDFSNNRSAAISRHLSTIDIALENVSLSVNDIPLLTNINVSLKAGSNSLQREELLVTSVITKREHNRWRSCRPASGLDSKNALTLVNLLR
jgi:hypothetical protein